MAGPGEAVPPRLLALLDGISDGLALFDADWKIIWINRAGAAILQRTPGDLLGRDVWEEFPDWRGTVIEQRYRMAVEQQEGVEFQVLHPSFRRWYEVRAMPAGDGMVSVYRDITLRRRNEVVLAGLVDTLTAIAADQPLETVLDNVTRMVERHSAKRAVASVLLLAEDGGTLHHGSAPSLPGWYNEAIDGLVIGPMAGSCGSAAYLGRQVIVEDIGSDPRWDDFRDLAVGAGLASCWSTPVLSSDGRVLATFAIYYREPCAPDADDQWFIEQVARTVAIAINHDRARQVLELSASQSRQVAEAFQRSLLTPPPAVPGVEIAVRYRPATEGAEVGGDWYDAFLLSDGGLGVVIGDVVGHDLTAAATMGQLRNMLRAIAFDSAESPAETMRRLNEIVDRMALTDLATVVFGCITPRSGRWQLDWCNAGHPPPILLSPDGEARLLSRPVGPPLGWPLGTRDEAALDLACGSTLVLYTDGLVERREEETGRRIGGLADLAALHASEDLQGLCDRLLDYAPNPQDDVAVVAVRLVSPPPA